MEVSAELPVNVFRWCRLDGDQHLGICSGEAWA